MLVISLIVSAVIIAADQFIKYMVVQNIALYEEKSFIPHILSLTHIRNTGAAWSIMEGKTWFLIGMPLIIAAAALIYMVKNRKGSKLELVSMALILGGGIGNLIDRIRMGEVVDYLKLELFKFPIFNFADMCIVVGAILFCICFIFFDDSDKEKSEKPKEKGGEPDGAAE